MTLPLTGLGLNGTVEALPLPLCSLPFNKRTTIVPTIQGKKMPGRMGNDTVLKKNIKVIDIRPDENVVLLKGPVPGAKNGLLKIFTK